MEIYLCATALVFYSGHVHAGVIGIWVEGRAPTWAAVRKELIREWPMLSAQIPPAVFLLLGILRILPGQTAITLAFATALAELMVGVVLACWKADATARQAAASIVVAGVFALTLIALKVFVHG